MGLWSSGRAIQWDTTHPGDRNLFLKIFQNFQGTRTCVRSVALRVSRALEATPPNLFSACVRTRTRVCACDVSVKCVGCVCPSYAR
jgi:hypothetical protein